SAIPGDPRRPGSLAIGVVRRAAVSGERCARSAGSAATPARASLPARAESGRAAGRGAKGVRRSLLPGSAVQGAGNILLTAERLPGTLAQTGRTAGRSDDTAWTRAQLGYRRALLQGRDFRVSVSVARALRHPGDRGHGRGPAGGGDARRRSARDRRARRDRISGRSRRRRRTQLGDRHAAGESGAARTHGSRGARAREAAIYLGSVRRPAQSTLRAHAAWT